jgi:hypothetical protein
MARTPTRKASRKRATAKAATRKGQTTLKPAPKRPPEIPLADWRRLGERQRRRYAGFYRLHPGAPRYRARGKAAGESLTRRERLAQRIAAFAARQEQRSRYVDADDLAERIQTEIAAKGEGWFGRIERGVRDLHAAWLANGRKTIGHSMADIADGLDWEWEPSELHYH